MRIKLLNAVAGGILGALLGLSSNLNAPDRKRDIRVLVPHRPVAVTEAANRDESIPALLLAAAVGTTAIFFYWGSGAEGDKQDSANYPNHMRTNEPQQRAY